jgi:hypothetical protein
MRMTDFSSLIATVLAVALGFYQSYDSTSQEPFIDAFLKGASIGILAFLITDKISSIAKQATVNARLDGEFRQIRELFDERSKSVEGLVAGRRRVVLLGSANNAIDRIVASVKQAIYAWNVYASFGAVDDFKYPKPQRKLVTDSIRTFLKKDGSKWLEVTNNIDDIRERMKEILEDKEVHRDNYACFLLREKWPVMNFVVFEFTPGRDKEVFFGFGRHPNDEVGNVFYSTDSELVEMFLAWHRTLRIADLSSPVLKTDLTTSPQEQPSQLSTIS